MCNQRNLFSVRVCLFGLTLFYYVSKLIIARLGRACARLARKGVTVYPQPRGALLCPFSRVCCDSTAQPSARPSATFRADFFYRFNLFRRGQGAKFGCSVST